MKPKSLVNSLDSSKKENDPVNGTSDSSKAVNLSTGGNNKLNEEAGKNSTQTST